MNRYCHESGLILKLIKSTTTPVNMRSIAFQMEACRVRIRMTNGEGGGGGGGSGTHKHFARVSHVKLE